MLKTIKNLLLKKRPPSPWWFQFIDQPYRPPAKFVQFVLQEYGNTVKMPRMMGNYYAVCDPISYQHILLDNHANFIRLDLAYSRLKRLLGDGLLTNNNTETWPAQRELLQPYFYPQNTARHSKKMTDVVLSFIKVWDEYAEQQKPINISQEMTKLTLSMAGKVLYDYDLQANAGTIVSWIITCNRYISTMPIIPPEWFPSIGNIRFKKARAGLFDLMNDILTKHRSHAAQNNNLLNLITQSKDPKTGESLGEQFILDELLTFLITGHESLGTNLGWMCYLLAENPAEQQTLQNELTQVLNGHIATADDIPNLPYAKMVAQESFRLYPPIWAIPRLSLKDDEINGFFIPANSQLLLCTYAMHRNPDYWEKPDQFFPEHFTAERIHNRPKYTYLPFGGGKRICLASSFALYQAQLIISTLAQHYEFHPVPQKINLECLITLKSKDGLKVLLKKRK